MSVVVPKPSGDVGQATAGMGMPSPVGGGSMIAQISLQVADVSLNRCGELMNPLKGAPAPSGREGGQLGAHVIGTSCGVEIAEESRRLLTT